MRSATSLALALALSAAAPPARSAPQLVTDRPDRTESASIVGRGYFQLEIGFTHARSEGTTGDLSLERLPETLARVGLTPDLELRVGLDGYGWLDPSDSSGLGDGSVGFKLGLAGERGRRPQAALLATLSLPTGDDPFTSHRADPSFRINLSHNLTDRLSLGYNAGAAWRTEEDGASDRDTLSVFEWTAALGIGATERLGFFVELFGEIPLSGSGSSSQAFDGGLTYLLRGNLQLDGLAGLSFSGPDGWFAGLGVSFRLPR